MRLSSFSGSKNVDRAMGEELNKIVSLPPIGALEIGGGFPFTC